MVTLIDRNEIIIKKRQVKLLQVGSNKFLVADILPTY